MLAYTIFYDSYCIAFSSLYILWHEDSPAQGPKHVASLIIKITTYRQLWTNILPSFAYIKQRGWCNSKLELGVQHNVEESTRSYLGDPVHRYGNCHQQPRRQNAEYLQTSGAHEKPTATTVQVDQLLLHTQQTCVLKQLHNKLQKQNSPVPEAVVTVLCTPVDGCG
jgi:hypothetical protein